MNTTINQKFANRLRELRQKFGYTQEKLAELAGVDYKHVQLLESKNAPAAKLDTVEKIAKAFKIDVSKLLKF
ncbi:MAG: helix-turn-helix transcriptional regulator [Candidatus Omnitrophica bacterium]|nr:helix-turn-helix transcriptional regulator [Candidatus Omnitrophota bacterium]